MAVILTIVRAFFDQTGIHPEQISEIEMFSGLSRGDWWIHVQPEQPWFAHVQYLADHWEVTPLAYLNP